MEKGKILEKMKHYCSYQERCHQDVRSKLLRLKVYGDNLEEIMSTLIQENFLNEERFARSYARGKFNNNQWGKNKIALMLKLKGVSEYCISKGIEEIDPEDYTNTLNRIARQQWDKYSALIPYERKNKTIGFCVNKGYGYEDVSAVVEELVKEL